MTTHHLQITTVLRRASAVTALALGLGLALAPGGDLASAAPAEATRATSEVSLTDNALDQAITNIRTGHFPKARHQLERARVHLARANQNAESLIGAPPTDPESDDPPGPPAVLAATKLDTRVTRRAVPVLDGMTRPRVVQQLGLIVRAAQNRQGAMLDSVLALPEEGAGADYADGMADTLGLFTRQVTTLRGALDGYRLTAPAREALTDAYHRAVATQTAMNAAYGGGERHAHR